MKTSSILFAAGFILLPFCCSPLFAQQQNASPEKKITIIKRTVEADGSEVTETIVKKGKAAENFDVDKYVQENRDDKNNIEVTVTEVNDDNNVGPLGHAMKNFNRFSICDDKAAFLGVAEDSDEDENQPGLVVQITRGAAADKAGLHDNDKILSLNGTKTDKWSDLSSFVQAAKPGDKVTISYSRNGTIATTEAVLTTRKDINDFKMPEINLKGLGDLKFDFPSNLEVNVKQKDACLGVYSRGNDEHGATIQSFTSESAAQEAGMLEGDVVLSVNSQLVNSHSELWDEIAKYKTGDKVQVVYERDGKSMQVEAALKSCQDKSRVEITNETENGEAVNRRFYTWNWDKNDQRRLKETRIIIIRKAGEGDGTKVNVDPNAKPAQDRSLALQAFRTFPNPSQGQVTVEFKGEPVATVVSLFDMSGRQLFREELNAFDGNYSQQFDLTAYAKGTILIHVLQGEKVYTEQVIVN